MDIAAAQVEAGHVKDEVAERCQKRFQDFLEEWRDEGDQPKYLELANERVTFEVKHKKMAKSCDFQPFYGPPPRVAPQAVAVRVSKYGGLVVEEVDIVEDSQTTVALTPTVVLTRNG